MKTNTFNVVTSVSMVLTTTVAALSIVGIGVTGFYPGIVVLFFVALIPIASKVHARNKISKSYDSQRNYYTRITIINLLSSLVVLWMTFVILVDRVFGKVL